VTEQLEAFFIPTPPPDPTEILRQELIAMIRDRDHATPRHLQKELGPSEVAHPCLRKLAFGLLDVPRANTYYDPLPSIIGTAVHTWLQSAAAYANGQLGRERWLTETRVQVAPGLSGSADLYDRDTQTVVDWKVPGKNRFDMYRKTMSPIYRVQTQLYGRGFIRAGFPVKQVGVCLVPRGNGLDTTHLWLEPYDPKVADEAVARREQVLGMLDEWQIETHPARFSWFAKSGPDCLFCKYFRPRPESPFQCEGVDL